METQITKIESRSERCLILLSNTCWDDVIVMELLTGLFTDFESVVVFWWVASRAVGLDGCRGLG